MVIKYTEDATNDIDSLAKTIGNLTLKTMILSIEFKLNNAECLNDIGIAITGSTAKNPDIPPLYKIKYGNTCFLCIEEVVDRYLTNIIVMRIIRY